MELKANKAIKPNPSKIRFFRAVMVKDTSLTLLIHVDCNHLDKDFWKLIVAIANAILKSSKEIGKAYSTLEKNFANIAN